MIDFKNIFVEMLRYGTVTAVSYVALYIGTFLLVEKMNWSPNVAYGLLITLIYIGVYISYTKFVFKKKFSEIILKRFLIALVFIWVLNNAFFAFFLNILNIHYLIVLVLNTVILGGLRFFIHRTYVFANEN